MIRVDGSPLAVMDSFTLEQLKTPGIVEYRIWEMSHHRYSPTLSWIYRIRNPDVSVFHASRLR